MASYVVDTDGTSGDYSSFSALATALDAATFGTFTEDIDVTLQASTSAADTTAVSLRVDTGSYQLTITGTDGYVLQLSGSDALVLGQYFGYEENITIQDVVFERTAQNANNVALLELEEPRDGTIIVERCTFIGGGSASYRNEAIAIYANGSYTADFVVRNNVFYDAATSAHPASCWIRDYGSGRLYYLYNNTFIGAATAIYSSNAYTRVINCLATSTAFGNSGTWEASSDYNATTAATATGGTHDRTGQTFTFVDVANDDYSLSSSDGGARDYGVDLSSATFGFSDDFDGDTRSGTWDIGADEYVAAGGTTYNVSASDGVSLSDSPSGTLTIAASATDGASLSDAPSGVLVMQVAAADGLAMADAPTGPLTIAQTIADGISLADAASGAFTFKVATADGVTFADAASDSGGTLFAVTVADGISLSDSSNAVLELVASIADGITLTDASSSTATINAVVNDGVSFSDAVSTALAILASVTDGIKLSDVSIDSTFLPVGQVRVTVTSAQASVSITYKQAGVTVASKQAGVTVTTD